MNISRPVSGFLFGCAGIACLAAMDATVKSLGGDVPTTQIVVFRYGVTAVLLGAFILLTRRDWPLRKNLRRHTFRGAMMALTAYLFFYAVGFIPLAVVTALAMTAPIYVSALGVLFLREKLSSSLVISIVLGIVGSLIIIFADGKTGISASGHVLAWAAAILAPVSYAVALVALKHHSSDEGAVSMTMAQSAAAMLLFVPLALPGFTAPPSDTWFQIVLMGALGTAGFLFLLFGLRRLPASVFSIVDYTALLWAAGFGFFLFGEPVSLILWLGGGLIILACVFGVRGSQAAKPAPA